LAIHAERIRLFDVHPAVRGAEHDPTPLREMLRERPHLTDRSSGQEKQCRFRRSGPGSAGFGRWRPPAWRTVVEATDVRAHTNQGEHGD